MYRWLILASIFIGLASAENFAASLFGQCSYTGDPHLRPFPSAAGQVTNMYFCQKPGWEVLLKNDWVLILVKVGPSPYVILDYLVIFFDGGIGIKCILFGSGGLSTCPSSSTIFSITNSGGTSWNHWYPAAQFFSLAVTSFTYGAGKRYDIVIRETFALIGTSSGICVKFDCPLESIIVPLPVPPIVVKLCDVYIRTARQRLIGRVEEETVQHVTTACQNDLSLTFDRKFAQTAVSLLIHLSLQQTDSDDYRKAAIKAENQITSALAEADRLAAGVLGQADQCTQIKRCFGLDLE